LLGAVLTGDSAGFQAAAKDFTTAIANWPKKPSAPAPSGLPALVSIARLEQGRMADSYPDAVRELEAVIAAPNCQPTPVMSTAFCSALIDTARTWLGWLAYRKNEFDHAGQILQPVTG